MRTLLILLSRPSDSMNRNREQMKPEATRLTEAQRCGINAKLSKPNVLSKSNTKSKRAVFDDANNKEYCVVMLEDIDEVLEMMRIEEEPPLHDEIQPT